jgi:hypothetical protein
LNEAPHPATTLRILDLDPFPNFTVLKGRELGDNAPAGEGRPRRNRRIPLDDLHAPSIRSTQGFTLSNGTGEGETDQRSRV